jgi:DNA-binding transcriptional regulator YiaG
MQNQAKKFSHPRLLSNIAQTQARYMGLMLPNEIKALRKRFALTQGQLGDLLQVGEKSYCRWETGRSRPSRSTNVLLCALRDGKITIPYLGRLQKPFVDWCVPSLEQPIIVSFDQQMETGGLVKVA